MPEIRVRPAVEADTDDALRVLRRSITEMCILDHQNDESTLELWLGNKTPDYFARWLASDAALLVAELDGCLRGVGYVTPAGKIHLCYVEPGYERQGLGAAIVAALEQQARDWGLKRLELESSQGAREFYARLGYRPYACSSLGFGKVRCYPFEKVLEHNS